MGNLSINGAMSICPDPDYQTFGTPVKGAFVGGGIVRQGNESGVLKFPPLNSAMRNELYTKWATNKNGLVGGAIPAISGYGWQTVTAAFGEPLPTGFDGEWAHGTQMVVYKIVRY